MVGRVFSCAVWTAAAVLLFADAGAATSRKETDGCAVLRHIVRSQIDDWSASAVGDRARASPGDALSVSNAPFYCSATAATVSNAFGSAMQAAGMPVSWSAESSVPADYCPDRYLLRCYPLVGPPGGSGMATQPRYVHNVWQAIIRSVMDSMPYGAGTDMAVFDRHALGESLAHSLRRKLNVEGGSAGRATR
jgi:hypothetical protein